MATLQKIRSKGVLLLAVIGLALLAFILGDAWKILRPNQGVAVVGEANGKNINAQDYQQEVEKYAEIARLQSGVNSLSDDEYAYVKDQTWNDILRRSLMQKEADALGLTVTDAEILATVEQGADPLLLQTPFQGQDGSFDADYLKSFLAAYGELDRSSIPNELLKSYDDMYNYWCFIENNLRQNSLISKYASLIQASLLSNPVSRKASWEDRARQADVLLTTVPYSTVADTTIQVSMSDVKKLYDERKPIYRHQDETRSISFIDYEIVPSEADRQALMNEVADYAQQLASTEEEYASFIRLTESVYPYSEVAFSKKGYPQDIADKFDSVQIGEVYGPYYNADDDTYNAFKVIAKSEVFDSVQFSAIQVPGSTEAEIAALADSIYKVVLAGTPLDTIAAAYAQSAAPQWMTSANFEGASLTGDNAAYLNKLTSMNKGELAVLKLDQVTLILKVYDQKNKIQKYNAAVVKRPAYFSNETSNEAYNNLSLFVANNNTAELLEANAEDNGYRLLAAADFRSDSHNVGSVAKSHDALRWVYEAKPGEVSRIYEVGENSDHLLVVALDKINKKGYTPVEDLADVLKYDVLRDKKAAIIKDQIAKAGNIASMSGVKTDTLKYVNFASPAFVSSTVSSESLVGAAVAKLADGETCAPVKGDGGVWVAKKISADSYTTEYDDETEKSRLKSNDARYITNMFLSVLYDKANVTDSRYKFF